MLLWKDVIHHADEQDITPPRRVEKTEEEWKKILKPEVFQITRMKGTERPFSSEMCSILEPGLYACAACQTVLFDSREKFESGTGWPSFQQPVDPSVIAYHADKSHGMVRVEVTCSVCDSHLGHVFPDGPKPSGLRYCINALSLNKVK